MSPKKRAKLVYPRSETPRNMTRRAHGSMEPARQFSTDSELASDAPLPGGAEVGDHARQLCSMQDCSADVAGSFDPRSPRRHRVPAIDK